MEGLEKFPKYDQAIKSIQRLNKIKWPDFNNYADFNEFATEIQKIIHSEFEIIPNILKPFTSKTFTLPIFRVREVNSFTNIDLIAEHSYPPLNLTKIGRCNFPKNPVFYGSDNPMTAIAEVIRGSDYKERKFCISRWDLIESEEHLLFQTFLHSSLDPENHYGVIGEDEFKRLNEPFQNQLTESQIDGLKEYLKFLNNLFINDKNYGLSATIAHRTLYADNNHSTDILMYPSVQTLHKGVNLAIHPNFVDNKMALKRLYIVEVEKFDKKSGKFNISFTKYADLDKNVIMWKNLKLDGELYKEYFTSDFKALILPNHEWKFVKRE